MDTQVTNPNEEDYKLLKHWRSGPWLALRSGRSKHTTPTLSLYMEDNYGQLVPSEVQDEVLADARGFWVDQLREGRGTELVSSQKLGFQIREEFRKALETKHPWLRLCAGHWKVRQVWINHFSSWRNTSMPPDEEPIIISSEGEEDAPPIEISDSDGSVAAAKKRVANTDNEGTGETKRQKVKQITSGSDFHPQKPRPKPTKSKAKVSDFLFLASLTG